jgi:catechol 2,3-dioxygenase-like lactoylglutathione lyase family enzyme
MYVGSAAATERLRASLRGYRRLFVQIMGGVMIDHTGLQISDPVVSCAFYDKALAPLGYKMLVQIPKEHTGGVAVFGYGIPPKADFWVGEGTPNAPRVHVAFRAETHKQVDEFYQAALAAGGKDNGSPGPRPHYHKDYYGAFVLDPDGHNVEGVCHEPK